MPDETASSRWNRVLSRVQAPGQYVGGEPNEIRKDPASIRLRFAFCFPDTYGIGMSYHGLRLLYEIANGVDGVAAERAFVPLPDMERELRTAGLPLSTWETRTPLADCDVVGFSLSYELCGAGVLALLDLGGVGMRRAERPADAPLVIAGGHVALNPEPFSDFIDVFLLGDGEDALPELLALARDAGGRHRWRKEALLERLAAEVEGCYVPALYTRTAGPGGRLIPAGPAARRRVVADFDAAPQVRRPLVPVSAAVHERAVVEILRGCPNGCRFCQAGFITRPVRERRPETILSAARDCVAASGFDEIGLLSLSTSNYSRLDELLTALDREWGPKGVGLSLPSLRVDQALAGLPAKLGSVRKSGLTVAPEAGTERLRAVINKDVRDDHLLAAADEAFRRGWQAIKLYFMVGLPTETDDDVAAIATLAMKVAALRKKGGRPCVTLSVSNFVPKPHTPFQWENLASEDELRRRQRLVATGVDRRKVTYHGHDPVLSRLEGVLARGDARLGAALLGAYERGARLDAWTEHFSIARWREALAAAGLTEDEYVSASLSPGDPVPWDAVDAGFAPGFLARERERAYQAAQTPACGAGCAGCGVSGCALAGGC